MLEIDQQMLALFETKFDTYNAVRSLLMSGCTWIVSRCVEPCPGGCFQRLSSGLHISYCTKMIYTGVVTSAATTAGFILIEASSLSSVQLADMPACL